jgi:BirA family biotin operon repressor/biotin-[acetyl-CoA-carboxylase] ligase
VRSDAHGAASEAPGAWMAFPLGHPRVHLRSTDSTNDRARALATAGAPHGTLVTAGEQTAGRGRQGRRWTAPANSCVLMSLLLRAGSASGTGATAGSAGSAGPAESLPSLLPLIAAVAVCDAVGAQARIKWPNDVVMVEPQGLAKLAGILVEARPQQGWAVLGVGVNVAVRLEELPPELHGRAATLALSKAEIEPTLERLLRALGQRLADLPQRTLEAWRERDALRGRTVTWAAGSGRPEGSGRAEGIDGAGRLVVALADGGRVTLNAGEVHIARTG